MKNHHLRLSVLFIAVYLFWNYSSFIFFCLTGQQSWLSLWQDLNSLFLLTGVICFLFIVNAFYFILNKWFRKIHIGLLILHMFLAFFSYVCLRYIIEQVITFRLAGNANYKGEFSLGYYFTDNIYYGLTNGSIGIIYFFIVYSIRQVEEKNNILIRQQRAELVFLRSQINPHFLFNSLNNIYALIYQNSEKALPTVQKLSELLRYMLYEEKEKVELGDEILYLQNYIELQKMRYDYPIPLKLEMEKTVGTLAITPLLLIPFVENAFKHGDFRDPDRPLFIKLYTENTTLHFTVQNKKGNYAKDKTSGIGLDNVRRRLELIYSHKHILQIQQTESEYIVHLVIEL